MPFLATVASPAAASRSAAKLRRPVAKRKSLPAKKRSRAAVVKAPATMVAVAASTTAVTVAVKAAVIRVRAVAAADRAKRPPLRPMHRLPLRLRLLLPKRRSNNSRQARSLLIWSGYGPTRADYTASWVAFPRRMQTVTGRASFERGPAGFLRPWQNVVLAALPRRQCVAHPET